MCVCVFYLQKRMEEAKRRKYPLNFILGKSPQHRRLNDKKGIIFARRFYYKEATCFHVTQLI